MNRVQDVSLAVCDRPGPAVYFDNATTGSCSTTGTRSTTLSQLGEEYVRLRRELKHCSLYLWKQLEEAHELGGNIMADDTVPEARSFGFLRAVLYQVARLQQIRANLQKALKTMILPNGYFDHYNVRLHELGDDY